MTHQTPAIDTLASGGSVRPDRDRVLTIAIGDATPYGNGTVPAPDFRRAGQSIARSVRQRGGTVYALTQGAGVGSDDDRNGVTERTIIILAGNVRDVAGLRRDVSSVLQSYGMTSACFALDRSHEPVFDTADGSRR